MELPDKASTQNLVCARIALPAPKVQQPGHREHSQSSHPKPGAPKSPNPNPWTQACLSDRRGYFDF